MRAAYNWGLIEESMLKLILKSIFKKCLKRKSFNTFEESADLHRARQGYVFMNQRGRAGVQLSANVLIWHVLDPGSDAQHHKMQNNNSSKGREVKTTWSGHNVVPEPTCNKVFIYFTTIMFWSWAHPSSAL